MTQRLTSWVTSANSAESDFPLNNLPCGVFTGAGHTAHCCIAIGDQILDVTTAEAAGLLPLAKPNVFANGSWNAFMALDDWSAFRRDLIDALSEGSASQSNLQAHLLAQKDVQMQMCKCHSP